MTVKRCRKCHYYSALAPTPELGHTGSNPGPNCNLPHYPSPCDWRDKDNSPCGYYVAGQVHDQAENNHNHVSEEPDRQRQESLLELGLGDSQRSGGRGDISGGISDVIALQEEIEKLRREKEEENRRSTLLETANQQLRENQRRLHQTNIDLQMPLLVSTTATLTTSTVTTTTTRPMMGTGYSVGMPSSIQSAITNHIASNAPRGAGYEHSIQGYNGPNIPDLRRDREVTSVADQVMARIFREIPALAPNPSANIAPPVASNTPLVPNFGQPPFVPPVYSSQSSTAIGSGRSAGASMNNDGFLALQQQAEKLKEAAEQQLLQLRQFQMGQQQPSQMNVQHQQVWTNPEQVQVPTPQYQPQDLLLQNQVPNNSVTLDSLFDVQIKCKQYWAHDFAKIGNFSYSPQIKQNNLNLATFGYGSVKHLLALADGTLPACNPAEYKARLQHILNVFEISCLGSNLADFDGYSWRVGREYNTKIVKDIENGYKTWESLDRNIDPTA